MQVNPLDNNGLIKFKQSREVVLQKHQRVYSQQTDPVPDQSSSPLLNKTRRLGGDSHIKQQNQSTTMSNNKAPLNFEVAQQANKSSNLLQTQHQSRNGAGDFIGSPSVQIQNQPNNPYTQVSTSLNYQKNFETINLKGKFHKKVRGGTGVNVISRRKKEPLTDQNNLGVLSNNISLLKQEDYSQNQSQANIINDPTKIRNAFLSYSKAHTQRPFSASKVKSRRKRTKININLHNKNDQLNNSKKIEVIEDKLKIIDKLLSKNDKMASSSGNLRVSKEEQFKGDMLKIINAERLVSKYHLQTHQTTSDYQSKAASSSGEEDNHTSNNLISSTMRNSKAKLLNNANSSLYQYRKPSFQNLSSLNQAQLLYGMGKKDHFTSSNSRDKLHSFQQNPLGHSNSGYLKGGKKSSRRIQSSQFNDINNIINNENKETGMNFHQRMNLESYQRDNDQEVVIQIKRQLKASKPYTESCNTSKYYLQSRAESVNKSRLLSGKRTSNSNREVLFKLLGRENSNVNQILQKSVDMNKVPNILIKSGPNFSLNKSKDYNQPSHLEYKDQDIFVKTIDHANNNFNKSSLKVQQNEDYNNIVIKIHNLNQQIRPTFRIIGTSQNFSKNPSAAANQSKRISNTQQQSRAQIAITKHLNHSKPKNSMHETQNHIIETQSFHNSDMLSVNSNAYLHQEKTFMGKTPPFLIAEGISSLQYKSKAITTRKQTMPPTSEEPEQMQELHVRVRSTNHTKRQKLNQEQKDSTQAIDNKQNVLSEYESQQNGDNDLSYQNNQILNRHYSTFSIGYSKPNKDLNKKKEPLSKPAEISSSDHSYLQGDQTQNQQMTSVFSDYALNESEILKLMTKRNYTKLKRNIYSNKVDNQLYNNRDYVNSLEIKERVAASKQVKIRDKLKKKSHQ